MVVRSFKLNKNHSLSSSSFHLLVNPADAVLHALLWSRAGSKSARDPPQTKHWKCLWSLGECGRCAPSSRATICLLLPQQVKKQTLLNKQTCTLKVILTHAKVCAQIDARANSGLHTQTRQTCTSNITLRATVYT